MGIGIPRSMNFLCYKVGLHIMQVYYQYPRVIPRDLG